jgi:spore coat protein CotF
MFLEFFQSTVHRQLKEMITKLFGPENGPFYKTRFQANAQKDYQLDQF